MESFVAIRVKDLVSRIEGRISILEGYIKTYDPSTYYYAFLSGRISGFRSVLTILNNIHHD